MTDFFFYIIIIFLFFFPTILGKEHTFKKGKRDAHNDSVIKKKNWLAVTKTFGTEKTTFTFFSCSLLYFVAASSELKWNSVPEVPHVEDDGKTPLPFLF